MKHIPLYIVLLFISVPAMAQIPKPIWESQNRGPTGTVELAKYIVKVLPNLPQKAIDEISIARKNGAKDAELNAIIYATRLNETVNKSAPTVYQELNTNLKTFESQWHAFVNPESYSSNKAAVSTLESLLMLNEIQKRIDDKKDKLDNLEKYNPLFDVPGAALTIYWKAEKLFWKMDKERTENILKFLINSQNKNGFTIGNSYYFLGKMYNEWYSDKDQAFTYYMKVHKYPACLVYTAFSYFEAGCVLSDLRKRKNALALLAIDVPSVDFKDLKCSRHLVSAEICRSMYDYTNVVRHLQAALIANSNCTEIVESISFNTRGKCEEIWDSQIINTWSSKDILRSIENGLSSHQETPDDTLYVDALMHEWPLPEDIPENIATNRVLNNNVFSNKLKRR